MAKASRVAARQAKALAATSAQVGTIEERLTALEAKIDQILALVAARAAGEAAAKGK